MTKDSISFGSVNFDEMTGYITTFTFYDRNVSVHMAHNNGGLEIVYFKKRKREEIKLKKK